MIIADNGAKRIFTLIFANFKHRLSPNRRDISHINDLISYEIYLDPGQLPQK